MLRVAVDHAVGDTLQEIFFKLVPQGGDFFRGVRKLVLGGICGESTEGGAPVLLICRSGKRSLEAGMTLIKEGFCDVYNVAEGFEGELDEHHHRGTLGGWRSAGLPWEQC